MRFEGDGHEIVATRQYRILCLFASSAIDSAALPADMAVDGRYEVALVSATVASHIRHLPSCHGISVSPSGRFPSVLVRPAGSLIAGMSVRVRERCIM